MVDALKPPKRKNPLSYTRLPLAPPGARSRAALAFTARAAEGRLMLQQCGACGALAYPPRDICGTCWSDKLRWRDISPEGKLLAETTLHASTNVYFRERLPWRVGSVKLAVGPVVLVHLHGDVREGDDV
ncbi:MAG TPA: zinc ribbon domain-containing protein, partial [Parvularculaceae bacterium]|nr:zinc ribbon domain-containing protein [Parvularculaceae bacterium]